MSKAKNFGWSEDWELLGFCLLDNIHFTPTCHQTKELPGGPNSVWCRWNKKLDITIMLTNRDQTKTEAIREAEAQVKFHNNFLEKLTSGE